MGEIAVGKVLGMMSFFGVAFIIYFFATWLGGERLREQAKKTWVFFCFAFAIVCIAPLVYYLVRSFF